MTTAERVLIRWLSWISAGVTAALAILLAAPDINIDQTVIVIAMAFSAFLSTISGLATTQSGGEVMGVKRNL
jgi:phage-related minor tail protein